MKIQIENTTIQEQNLKMLKGSLNSTKYPSRINSKDRSLYHLTTLKMKTKI